MTPCGTHADHGSSTEDGLADSAIHRFAQAISSALACGSARILRAESKMILLATRRSRASSDVGGCGGRWPTRFSGCAIGTGCVLGAPAVRNCQNSTKHSPTVLQNPTIDRRSRITPRNAGFAIRLKKKPTITATAKTPQAIATTLWADDAGLPEPINPTKGRPMTTHAPTQKLAAASGPSVQRGPRERGGGESWPTRCGSGITWVMSRRSTILGLVLTLWASWSQPPVIPGCVPAAPGATDLGPIEQ